MPIDERVKEEILESIRYEGSAEKTVNLILGSRNHLRHIIDFGSGLPRIHRSIIGKFKLILSQPENLAKLNSLEIRCVLCKRVISYPCWYYSIKYVVNHFHYFVCFDAWRPDAPTTKCYRKDV